LHGIDERGRTPIKFVATLVVSAALTGCSAPPPPAEVLAEEIPDVTVTGVDYAFTAPAIPL